MCHFIIYNTEKHGKSSELGYLKKITAGKNCTDVFFATSIGKQNVKKNTSVQIFGTVFFFKNCKGNQKL